MNWLSKILIAIVATASLAACDTVQPIDAGTLVVESYLRAGEPLPTIRLSRTFPVADGLGSLNGVSDADVVLILDGTTIVYEPDRDEEGVFRPPSAFSDFLVPPLATFRVEIDSGQEEASASGTIPPSIKLDDVLLTIPDEAIEAVLLDTLDIGIDSLDLGLNAQEGFIYPIEVQLSWMSVPGPNMPLDTDGDGNGDGYWIETRLEPVSDFSSSLVDFFLLPRQVLPEAGTTEIGGGMRSWTGVYAVPVESADTPVPKHVLTVSLLRGERSFAVFETSRENPTRGEPVSNITGGIGFVGGIALDTLRVSVE